MRLTGSMSHVRLVNRVMYISPAKRLIARFGTDLRRCLASWVRISEEAVLGRSQGRWRRGAPVGNRKPYCSARSTSQSGSPRSDQLPPPAAVPAWPRPRKLTAPPHSSSQKHCLSCTATKEERRVCSDPDEVTQNILHAVGWCKMQGLAQQGFPVTTTCVHFASYKMFCAGSNACPGCRWRQYGCRPRRRRQCMAGLQRNMFQGSSAHVCSRNLLDMTTRQHGIRETVARSEFTALTCKQACSQMPQFVMWRVEMINEGGCADRFAGSAAGSIASVGMPGAWCHPLKNWKALQKASVFSWN